MVDGRSEKAPKVSSRNLVEDGEFWWWEPNGTSSLAQCEKRLGLLRRRCTEPGTGSESGQGSATICVCQERFGTRPTVTRGEGKAPVPAISVHLGRDPVRGGAPERGV